MIHRKLRTGGMPKRLEEMGQGAGIRKWVAGKIIGTKAWTMNGCRR